MNVGIVVARARLAVAATALVLGALVAPALAVEPQKPYSELTARPMCLRRVRGQSGI